MEWVAIMLGALALATLCFICDELKGIRRALERLGDIRPVQPVAPTVNLDVDAEALQAVRNLTGALNRLRGRT